MLTDGDDSTPRTTPSRPTSSASSTTSTSIASDAERIWPDPTTSRRFTEPRGLAHFFAVDALGFREPMTSELVESGPSVGRITVRAHATGPTTVVSVERSAGDRSWWVTAATSDAIQLDRPTRGALVASPLRLNGSATAFEGTVAVEIRDAHGGVIGEGFLTASAGPMRGPFDGAVPFRTSTTPEGLVVLLSRSPQDGGTVAASVQHIRFV
jgi:hypothetical protein